MTKYQIDLNMYLEWLEARRENLENESVAIWRSYATCKERYVETFDKDLFAHLEVITRITKHVENSRACFEEIALISAEIIRVKTCLTGAKDAVEYLSDEILNYFIHSIKLKGEK